MNLNQIRAIAKEHGIKSGKLTKVDLVRTIQRTEGNYDCFATPAADNCDQIQCLWRDDCLPASHKPHS